MNFTNGGKNASSEGEQIWSVSPEGVRLVSKKSLQSQQFPSAAKNLLAKIPAKNAPKKPPILSQLTSRGRSPFPHSSSPVPSKSKKNVQKKPFSLNVPSSPTPLPTLFGELDFDFP